MPGSLRQPLDLAALAANAQALDERLSLTELPRLVEALPAAVTNGAPIECSLAAVADEADQVVLTGRLTTRWSLVCQRCLGEMNYDVDVAIRWTFRRDDESAFVLTDEPVRLLDYVEDELLLELPNIPLHVDEAECGEFVKRYMTDAESDEAPSKRTPFANLRALMDGRD